ncbi:class 1 isoprenoid biosynthesis enzyme [Alkaliphilus serpentinus]|uniref:Class 1 isoprenoid biosynthesis enzyme n=1 Tax=Alkaliphilus serpentinus TaxID=1482731 RepID=A0A833HPP0_9FIRM|nr:class 1 isoprenoid biosynthesis enzyme [Alkaliphilus serpentinus]KAB3531109.1 class 1 isoprenoid biosynthesis enzyme [Alkaliphilus serpentinus]
MKAMIEDRENIIQWQADPEFDIEDLKEISLKLWWQSVTEYPTFIKKISLKDKRNNEKRVEEFRKKLEKRLEALTEEKKKNEEWSKEIIQLIKELEVSIIGYENSCIDFFSRRGYSEVTEDFLNAVKEFDNRINPMDIFQAIRNVWIMNSIQILFDLEVRLTPAIFGYSMLYPYSDNYLDNEVIKKEDKVEFNNRFRQVLTGDKLCANNDLEGCIFRLVEKIEEQFPRRRFEGVYNSLLAIHTGQEKSLIQQKSLSLPYERDIMGISFEKGGSSVLADGYLVKGSLTREEEIFTFAYGTFLQIIDDLQDVEEDMKNGHMTIFSQVAGKWPLDPLVNKLFWYIEKVLGSFYINEGKDKEMLKNVIRESCRTMIMEAISTNKRFFSKKYLKDIEEYSMLRLTYFRKLKKKFSKSFSSKDINHICQALGNNR